MPCGHGRSLSLYELVIKFCNLPLGFTLFSYLSFVIEIGESLKIESWKCFSLPKDVCVTQASYYLFLHVIVLPILGQILNIL